MGVYSVGILESLTDEEQIEVEELIDDVDVEVDEIDIEESSLVLASRAVYESSVNWNRIMEACAIDELHFLEENGTEMIYEGERWDSFIDKATAFFLNLWEKIKGIFKAAVMKFDQLFKNDKEFYTKHKKEIDAAYVKDFGDKEYKMFKYDFGIINNSVKQAITATTMDIDSIVKDWGIMVPSNVNLSFTNTSIDEKSKESILDDYKTFIEQIDKDAFETGHDNYRAKFVDTNDKVTSSEFVSTLKEKLQGGNEKVSVPMKDAVKHATTIMSNKNDYTKILKEQLNAYKKAIDNIVLSLNKTKRDISKTKSDDTLQVSVAKQTVKIYSQAIDYTKQKQQIAITGTGVCIDCLKASASQNKSIVVAAVMHKEKKSVNAGGLFMQESGSLLDNISFK